MWKILGIEPTADMRAIKKAYAALAKKYNPEEHPEEFQRIFKAYKDACEYARRFKGSDNDSVNNSGLDFSDMGEKRETFEFSAVNENASKPHADAENDNEPSDDSDTYEFSPVNDRPIRSRSEESGETEEPQYDFSDVRGSHDRTEKRDEEQQNEETEHYDFSPINRERLESSEESRLASLRIDILRRLHNLLSDSSKSADYDAWYSFFFDTRFGEIVDDKIFRASAAKAFEGRMLTREVANLAAYCFGKGTAVYGKGHNRFILTIGVQTNRYSYTGAAGNKPLPKFAAVTVVAAAILIFIAFPMLTYFTSDGMEALQNNPGRTDQASPEVITLRPYEEGEDSAEYLADAFFEVVNETSFAAEDIYPLCMGTWEFTDGTVTFFEDMTFEMKLRDRTIVGNIDIAAADKGAELFLTFHSSDEFMDGGKAYARLVSPLGKSMELTNAHGGKRTAAFVQGSGPVVDE